MEIIKETTVRKFFVRLTTAFFILTHTKEHWFLVHFNKEELIHILKDEAFEATIMVHQLRMYNVNKAIRMIKSSVDEDDLLLQKIAFETEAELLSKSK